MTIVKIDQEFLQQSLNDLVAKGKEYQEELTNDPSIMLDTEKFINWTTKSSENYGEIQAIGKVVQRIIALQG